MQGLVLHELLQNFEPDFDALPDISGLELPLVLASLDGLRVARLQLHVFDEHLEEVALGNVQVPVLGGLNYNKLLRRYSW